jgi:hypothetical protein
LAEFVPLYVDHERSYAVRVPSSPQPSPWPQRLRPEPVDPAEDLGEQRWQHHHLGELKDRVTVSGERAPTSFSRSVVSDQSWSSSGDADGRS